MIPIKLEHCGEHWECRGFEVAHGLVYIVEPSNPNYVVYRDVRGVPGKKVVSAVPSLEQATKSIIRDAEWFLG